MAPYWLANIIVWSVVLVVALGGAFTAAFRKRDHVRRGDPMRLAVFLVASLFLGHNLRWLVAPHWDEAWKALFVAGALVALYVLSLMFSYGRGPLVVQTVEDADDE